MGWNFESAFETFNRHREMWDEINRNCGNHILLDSLFVEALIRHFGSKNTLLGISKDSKNLGMVLVEKTKHGCWQTFQPSQGPIGLILLGNKNDVLEQIEKLIGDLPGHALGFSIFQQDPDFTVFKNLNPCKKVEILEYIKTSRLTLTGTFEDYWKSRGRNLVHNLSRQRRRLIDQGFQLKLAVSRDPGQVADCIRDYGRLEGSGWKAERGSPISEDNRQGIFYREILENFFNRGEGVVYRLLINDKTAASDLCIERNGMMVILKTAYDESFQGLSLGLLLHQEIFGTLFPEGKIRVVEFYGRIRDFHTKWTDEMRTMYHINFYRYGWVATGRTFFKTLSKLFKNKDKK